MPLYVKDPQVDALADELTALKGSTKTEAVREALRNEIARTKAEPDLVEQTLAFTAGCGRRPVPDCRPTRHSSTAFTSATDVRGCVRSDGDPDR